MPVVFRFPDVTLGETMKFHHRQVEVELVGKAMSGNAVDSAKARSQEC